MLKFLSFTLQICSLVLFLVDCGGGGSGTSPAPRYMVIYVGNGNTTGSVPTDATTYEVGQTVTVRGNTGNLTKTGYAFSGWNTQTDGSGATYPQSQTFTMGSANVTLYAKWTAAAATAVLTLSTAVTHTIPATTTINGYDVTIILPAGVTLKSTTNPPIIDSGVVTAFGAPADSDIAAVYSAATSTLAGTAHILIVSKARNGFSVGKFCVVHSDIAAGTNITPSDFAPPTLFEASGFDTISMSTVSLTADLSVSVAVTIP